jgi:stalled ribosome rescue protein Dom34
VAEADLALDATRALQELDAARQVAMVRSLLDAVGASGHAACGAADVLHALERGAVDHLIVAPALVDRLPDALDQVVQEALGERAVIEVARPAAARLLEAQAGGIAARLRFPVPAAARPKAHVRPRPHRRQRTGAR